MSKLTMGRIRLLRQVLIGRNQSGFLSSFQGVLTNVLILAVNVATGIITARLLGPDDKGIQAATVLWPGILISLSDIGLHTALLYHIRKSEKLTDAFLSAALMLGVLASFVAMLIGIVFIPFSLANYSSETVRVAQIFMVFLPIAVCVDIYNSVAQAKGDFQTYNGLRLLQPIVVLTVLLLLAVTGRLTAFTAAFAFLCPSILALLWLRLRTRHLYRFSLLNFREVYGRLLSYGLRSYSGDVLAVCISQIDKLIIVGLLSPASMGLYTVAFSLARMLVVFETAVSSVLLPKMIGQTLDETWLLLGRAARVNTLVTFTAAVGLVLTGPLLIRLFYGEIFGQAVVAFWILVVASVLSSLAELLGRAFYALGKPEIMIFRHTLTLAVTVPAMLVLARYGINGVAAAVLLESVMTVALTLSAFPAILKVPLPRLWAPKEDLAYVSALWQEWKGT